MFDNWYCIATTGRKEPLAEAALRSAGFYPILPLFKNDIHNEKEKPVPFFLKYLFVQANETALLTQLTLWRQRRMKTGIENIVSIDRKPLVVDPEFMYNFRLHLDPLSNIYIPEKIPVMITTFIPGDVVRFKNGALSNLLMTIHDLDGPDRVSVLWQALGRQCIIRHIDSELLSKEIITTSESV